MFVVVVFLKQNQQADFLTFYIFTQTLKKIKISFKQLPHGRVEQLNMTQISFRNYKLFIG